MPRLQRAWACRSCRSVRCTRTRSSPVATFDEETLEGLTDSVRELGVLQPILVRAKGRRLRAHRRGERRWRAAKRAGLPTIPAVVRVTDDVSSLDRRVENLHRQDLNALEEAAAYQQLIDDFGLTQDQVATRVGKSPRRSPTSCGCSSCPLRCRSWSARGCCRGGHAKALLGHPDRSYQEMLARKAVADSLSVREVERMVKERLTWNPGWAPVRARARRGRRGRR